jgi:hypothetical protein
MSTARWLRTEVTPRAADRAGHDVHRGTVVPSGSAIQLSISVIVFVLSCGTPGVGMVQMLRYSRKQLSAPPAPRRSSLIPRSST